MSDELFERACEAVHDAWAATNVPYADLPESEKDLDRATVRAAVAPYVERIVELEAAAEASVQECARLREALDDNAESLRYEVDACAAQRERAERLRRLLKEETTKDRGYAARVKALEWVAEAARDYAPISSEHRGEGQENCMNLSCTLLRALAALDTVRAKATP